MPNDASSLVAGSPFVSYFNPHMPDPHVQDWNLTLEKEIMSNTVVRAGYFGDHTAHLEQVYNYNASTPSYVWFMTTGQPLPTGALASVLTNPYDKTVYGTIEQWTPGGATPTVSNWNWNAATAEVSATRSFM